MQEKVKQIVEDIFKHTNCVVTSCEFNEENGMTWCMIETPDSRFMIGREGDTLRSLNHLVQRMLDKDAVEEESPKIFIDINGYQKKRFTELKTLAHMMAERARYFKSNIEIDPMPSFERRIIHMFLEGQPDIKTESEGYGPNRKVVIKYIANKNLN